MANPKKGTRMETICIVYIAVSILGVLCRAQLTESRLCWGILSRLLKVFRDAQPAKQLSALSGSGFRGLGFRDLGFLGFRVYILRTQTVGVIMGLELLRGTSEASYI